MKVEVSFFLQSQFKLSSPNTKIFILLLAQAKPMSYKTGKKVPIIKFLKQLNKSNFHYIFPKKGLENLGFSKKEINALVNFCFTMNGEAEFFTNGPSKLKELSDKNRYSKILATNFIPEAGLEMEFREFIVERLKLLVKFAEKLIK